MLLYFCRCDAVTADSLSLSLAAAVLSCATGSAAASSLGVPGFSLGFIAVIASAFASLAASVTKSTDPEQGKATPFQGQLSRNWNAEESR